jgi:hypothetical protein
MSKTFHYSDFQTVDKWVNQTIMLITEKPVVDFEIRAVDPSEKVAIYLDYIEVIENIKGLSKWSQ